MSTDLMVNISPYEVRIALLEHSNLTEYYLERPVEKGLVGNIYRGKVVRVLPGMQAAFVDIGLERTGFLYVDDVNITMAEFEKRLKKHESPNCFCEPCGPGDFVLNQNPRMPINELLTEGQEILVQICKEPLGTKGARLTCHITLPCRNLVFMPMTDHIGISRKIEEEHIRQQLRADIELLRPAGTGFIVRTVAGNATREDLEADMEFLLHVWGEIQDIASKSKVGDLVYEDLDVTLRTVRDVFSPSVDRVIVDDHEAFNRVHKFVNIFAPGLESRVEHYDDETPLFTAYGIDTEINRALDRKVWLRCGSYIIIETTEALTVIDVNTGRYVGKNDLEETIYNTNMEAVKEIAYQLRLRNIGGIIIIDFIDMDEDTHREDVFRTLKQEVKKDKSRINVLRITEFGLVQMTRKRIREDLSRMMCEPCHCCKGTGMVKSSRTICYEILRKISVNAPRIEGNEVIVQANPQLAAMMLKEETAAIANMEKEIKKLLVIEPKNEMHFEHYEIRWKNNEKK
jgi:ribonuclease G